MAQEPTRSPFPRTLQDEMSRLVENWLGPTAQQFGLPETAPDLAAGAWSPTVDIVEESGQYLVTMDIPGVDPKNIDISLEGDILTIRGERSQERQIGRQEGGSYQRQERFYGSFYRRFTLPDTADPDSVKAEYQNGVLKLTIPKQEQARPRKIEVQRT